MLDISVAVGHRIALSEGLRTSLGSGEAGKGWARQAAEPRAPRSRAGCWNSFCVSVLKAEVNEGLSDMAFVLVCVLLPVFVGLLTLRMQ